MNLRQGRWLDMRVDVVTHLAWCKRESNANSLTEAGLRTYGLDKPERGLLVVMGRVLADVCRPLRHGALAASYSARAPVAEW